MTLKQWCEQANAYEYSAEYIDNLKECMQVDLMSNYLSAQTYLKEFGNAVDVPDGYLVESVEDAQFTAIYEEVNKKKNSLWTRFINMIKRIFNALHKAIHHGSTKFEEIEKDRAALESLMLKIPGENIPNISEIIERWYKKLSFTCVAKASKRPEWLKKIIKPGRELKPDEHNQFVAMATVAMGDVDRDLEITTTTNAVYVDPNAVEDIIKSIEDYFNAASGDIYKNVERRKKIAETVAKPGNYSNHIIINPMAFAHLTKALERAQSTIDKFTDHMKGHADAEVNSPAVGAPGTEMTKLYESVVKFQGAVGNLIKCYNELIMFRSHVVYDVTKVVKGMIKGKDSGTDNNDGNYMDPYIGTGSREYDYDPNKKKDDDKNDKEDNSGNKKGDKEK